MTREELMQYQASLKIETDLDSVLYTAEHEGIEKGRKEGKQEGIKEGEKRGIEKGKQEGIKEGEKRGIEKIVWTMFAQGFTVSQICRATGLTEEQISRFK